MPIAVLLTGSNLGNKLNTIREAEKNISETIGPITTKSSVYESEPWGFESRNKFLNQAIVCDTTLSPEELLETIHRIEERLGRQRPANLFEGDTRIYVSRVIDIDILFYDDLILQTENLIIPHPGICERNFVLRPLAEILPEFVHPVKKIKIKDLNLR
ncbi:MAG: 2-amino-4-hydroxy-6-hydroxymethyldihydropteridine diphosphokinase [Rikenellaceae bacterium]|nr:2-amino-4-hydroxy-6-hydroxymethyldihydropteridine diphosphokinase [Rikenellaceae bacterium]